MQTVDEYRGYEIVETDWTTEVRVGFDRAEVRPVYVIPGMKERPSSPFLTSVQEARDFIDEELAGREAMREARTSTFEASVKVRGVASLGVTIPADVARCMGLDVGDRVRVTVEKLRRGTEGPGGGRATGSPPSRDGGRREGLRILPSSGHQAIAWESARRAGHRKGYGGEGIKRRATSFFLFFFVFRGSGGVGSQVIALPASGEA